MKSGSLTSVDTFFIVSIRVVLGGCFNKFRKDSHFDGRNERSGRRESGEVAKKNVAKKNGRQEEWAKQCNQFTSCNECISDWKCAYCIGDAKCVFDEQGSCKTAQDHVGRNGLDTVKCPGKKTFNM